MVVGVLLVWVSGLSVMNICCLITSVVGCLFGFCFWVGFGVGWLAICWFMVGLGLVIWWGGLVGWWFGCVCGFGLLFCGWGLGCGCFCFPFG